MLSFYLTSSQIGVNKPTTIFTTNLPFDRRNEIFHDSVIMAIIVDYITHKSYVINMSGMSYRIQESKEFFKESVNS